MRASACLLGIILLICAAMPLASAYCSWNSSLAAFIECPEGDYDVGSEVTVTVHVFRSGDYFDPDFVNLTVGHEYFGLREVNLTKASVGHYEATFTILEGDIDWEGDVFLESWVEDGAGPDEVDAYAYFTIRGKVFDVTLVLSDYSDLFPEPGDTVDYQATVTLDGEPIDPDEIWGYVTDPDWDEVPSSFDRVGTGSYEGSFTIPGDLTESSYFEIGVSAEHYEDTFDYWDDAYDLVVVSFFDMWVHYLEITESSAEMEIFVLHMDNTPVEGASVNFTYEYEDDDWDSYGETLEGTTDAAGMVSLSLSYPELGSEESGVYFDVTAEAEGYTENYWDKIIVRDESSISEDWGLGISGFPLGVQPETTLVLDLTLTYDGVPLEDQDVFVYITDWYNIYSYEGYTTDGNGQFQMTITTPSVPEGDEGFAEVDVSFHTYIDGEWDYLEEWMFVADWGMGSLVNHVDTGTSLTITTVQIGDTAEATLECDTADGSDELAYLVWFVGPLEAQEREATADWVMLKDGSFFGNPMLIGTWSDGAYHFTITIPPFIPEDAAITMVGAVVFEPGTSGQTIRSAMQVDIELIPPDYPPLAGITSHADGAVVNGTLEVGGDVEDDGEVSLVEYNIDGGDWHAAVGTDAWTFTVDTTTLTSGEHFVEVRAWDGGKHSEVVNVTFTVDQAPDIAADTPVDMGKVSGTIAITGTASDDAEVTRVEYSLDGATWADTSGVESWTVEIDTTELTSDIHTLEVRSLDARGQSDTVTIVFEADQPPTISIVDHGDGKKYKDQVTFFGNASDDVGVTAIEVRIDEGEWVSILAADSWTYEVKTKELKKGEHNLQVRAFDGMQHSQVLNTTFRFEKEEESPGFGTMVMLLAFLAAVPAVLSRRRKE